MSISVVILRESTLLDWEESRSGEHSDQAGLRACLQGTVPHVLIDMERPSLLWAAPSLKLGS